MPTGLHMAPDYYAVFRLERATEVLELTYLGKYFACVNANWYPGKHRSRQ